MENGKFTVRLVQMPGDVREVEVSTDESTVESVLKLGKVDLEDNVEVRLNGELCDDFDAPVQANDTVLVTERVKGA